MEDPVDVKPLEFTGNFEKDYAEGCRLQSLTPFHFARIGQIVQASQVPKSLAGLSAQDKGSYLTLNKAKKGSVNDLAKKSTISESRPDLAGAKAPSRYRFAPTINIELSEEDDEVYKIEVRGWTIPPPMTDILTNAIAACSTVTHFTLSNCQLTNAQLVTVTNLVNNSNIRALTLDQNRSVNEMLFANLINDESALRSLSLRGNNIGDNGAKAIGNALKTNRSLTSISLWDNRIGRDGAEALAEAAKANSVLCSLSLGKNSIGDEGAIHFAKLLSNIALKPDEIMVRKKIMEIDKLKQATSDEDPKKGSAAKKGAVASRAPSGKPGPKTDDPKDKAKGGALKAPGKPPASSAAAKPSPKTPDDGGKAKKPAAADKNPKDAKKAGATSSPAGVKAKKGKDDLPADNEEQQPPVVDSGPALEPMFEVNGQWYILGNRSLCNLDLSANDISEIGLRHLLEAVSIQEATVEQAQNSDVGHGIYRISLHLNSFSVNTPQLGALNSLLNSRNPYYEGNDDADGDQSVSASDSASALGDDGTS